MADIDDDQNDYDVDEDAGSGPDGGNFATPNDIFTPDSFESRRSTFSTAQTPVADTRNPTFAQSQQDSRYTAAQPTTPPRHLVAQFNDAGQPWVAVFAGKRQLEEWRQPTDAELAKLRAKGKLVRGGIIEAQAQPTVGADAPAPGMSKGMKVAIGVGVVLVAGVGWWYYRKVKDDELNAEVVDV